VVIHSLSWKIRQSSAPPLCTTIPSSGVISVPGGASSAGTVQVTPRSVERLTAM
jgi:hypothetical protein